MDMKEKVLVGFIICIIAAVLILVLFDQIKTFSSEQTNKEISDKLNITTFTVKSHIHTVLSKTGISNRLKLAAVARKGTK